MDSRRNATSYRLAPYVELCNLVKLQPIELRRKIADALFAFDIFIGNVSDSYISFKFVRTNYSRSIRSSTVSLLVEPHFIPQYLRLQPIVKFICLINDYKKRFVNLIITINFEKK